LRLGQRQKGAAPEPQFEIGENGESVTGRLTCQRVRHGRLDLCRIQSPQERGDDFACEIPDPEE
jgi:hypothetical protein